MEIAIPALALGGLFLASKNKPRETFMNQSKAAAQAAALPNVDVPDVNYPAMYPIAGSPNPELDATSALSTVNRFDAPSVYTDKYFSTNPELNQVSQMTAVNVAQQSRSYTSMTGQTVDLDYFRHNNMAPFFGSKSRANNPSNATESTLDSYTGSGSQQYAKREVNSFFRPNEGYQWANGMPSTSEFVQSRIVPSMNMANVKPFDEVHVAPGLGLGYTAEGAGGYNSGMLARDQWLDKTVDQLRVANKQKASGLGMLGYEGPANSAIKRSATQDQQGIVEKNRVERTFEMGQNRLFTTTGAEKAPAMRAITIDDRSTRPETSMSYAGVAALGGGKTLQQVRGEYMPSHHQDLGAVPFTAAYAAGMGGARDGEYGRDAAVAYPNNRSFPGSGAQPAGSNYFGTAGAASVMGAVVAPLLDLLRPSRKENAVGNLRPYQNAKAPVEQMYVYDPSDRPEATMRDMTGNSLFHHNVNGTQNQNGLGYLMTEYDELHNQRDSTTEYFYAGNAGGADGSHQIRPYDAEYRQRNNEIKSSTIQGRLVPGNMSLMNHATNVRTVTDRDTLSQNRRAADGTRASQPPSQDTLGMLQGANTKDRYQTIQLDRNNGDVLGQLKKNPYTLSVVNGL
jgi:hypothetical protein